MERLLQGPIDPYNVFFGEHVHLDVECLQGGFFNTQESLRFEEGEEQEPHFLMPSLEDKMPFLQMLRSVESPPFFPVKEPNFQTLLKLQHLKRPWDMNTNPCVTETETQVQAMELESCVTHEIADLHSPVKSETKDLQNRHSSISCFESLSPDLNQNQRQSKPNSSVSSFPLWTHHPETILNDTHFSKSSPVGARERRNRKRTRPTKNKEEVESQRMTHIAIERNRRRQMNDHLNSLRSLMPPSYVQRGDQASIIGGAIDFVKELEQLLHSLEAEKRMRKAEVVATMGISPDGLLTPPPDCKIQGESGDYEEEEAKVKRKSEAAEIEVTAIQNHVNLKIECKRNPGQLLRAIVALEDLRFTVLHLNITSSESTVLYSFNLKIEDECKLESADEVATTVHQIFNSINRS